MPVRPSILTAPLLAVMLLVCSIVHADELGDISQLVSQGQHAQAMERVNGYLAAHPADVQGVFLKGVILAEQRKSADAIKIFSDIAEKHPELPEPYNNLAVLYAEQGQYDKARRALEMAIKTHPSYATAHENLGDVYAKMASDAYGKALQLDKNNARTQTKLTMVKELFSGGVRPVQVAARAEMPEKVAPISAPVVEAPAKPQTSPVPAAPPAVVPLPEPAKPAKAPVKDAEKPGKDKQEIAEKSDRSEQKEAVETTVKNWAKAWSAQRVDTYLSFYAEDFRVPGGENRHEWEKTRRERISAPSSIKVELSGIKVKMENNSRATASFRQSYRAGNVTKRTAKSLSMKKSGGKWLIEQEVTDR